MLLKLLAVLAIVVIEDVSKDIVARITKWIEKQDRNEEE